jgi:hypothetical protein
LTITQTVLTFVAIPAAVIAVLYALVYGGSARRSSKRYRPGRAFEFTPVWFLANPDRGPAASPNGAKGLTGSRAETALPPGSAATPAPVEPTPGEVGGASDSW